MNEDIPLKPALVGLAIGLAMLLVGETFTSNNCSCGGKCRCSCEAECNFSCECGLTECKGRSYEYVPKVYLEDEQNHNPDKDVK